MIRPYLILGVVGAIIFAFGFGYLKGRSDVSGKVRIEQLERDLKAVQDAYDDERRARQMDARQALEDRKDADLEATTIKEIEDALPSERRECFGAPDADRLRRLINRKNP